jgi:hypothetical protein
MDDLERLAEPFAPVKQPVDEVVVLRLIGNVDILTVVSDSTRLSLWKLFIGEWTTIACVELFALSL